MNGRMATVEELWNMAHDMYARARASLDPLAKRRLLRVADDYLKQANELRRTGVVIQAAFPDSKPLTVSEPVEPRPRKAAGS
jgi:hypothetical protein